MRKGKYCWALCPYGLSAADVADIIFISVSSSFIPESTKEVSSLITGIIPWRTKCILNKLRYRKKADAQALGRSLSNQRF